MAFIAVYHKFTWILKKHEKKTKMTSSDMYNLLKPYQVSLFQEYSPKPI